MRGRGRGEGRVTCDVVLTLRTWKYIERELHNVPLSIPVIILVSGHDQTMKVGVADLINIGPSRLTTWT